MKKKRNLKKKPRLENRWKVYGGEHVNFNENHKRKPTKRVYLTIVGVFFFLVRPSALQPGPIRL